MEFQTKANFPSVHQNPTHFITFHHYRVVVPSVQAIGVKFEPKPISTPFNKILHISSLFITSGGSRRAFRSGHEAVLLMAGPQAPFNRWLIPAAAVAIHLCIGSVYSWSTFNRPIKALFPNDPAWFSPPYTTFTTALVLLGLSAAFGGPWVERNGPRVAATAAAIFFGACLMIGGVGLMLRQSVMVFIGMGIIGGIGCGLGSISPVSTLVKWFPDRRGMATGMAVMGFGGGAFIAGYLNAFLIQAIGVAYTVMAL